MRLRSSQFDPNDIRRRRPTSLGQARRQIAAVFAENGWDERCQTQWLASFAIDCMPPEKLSLEDARKVLAGFEEARMILYQD